MRNDFLPSSWYSLGRHYSLKYFKKDLLAGITVGIVALPLAMAFAIGTGLPPERGLYTAIIAGFLISLLGGSRYQISGPTGAFVVIIFDIVARMGYEGLVLVTLLAGVILCIGALCRVGNWIKFIPYPLITGFTTGIAVLIISSQIKDFLGLKVEVPSAFLPKWQTLLTHVSSLDALTTLFGVGTLGLMLLIRKIYPKIPWGIGGVSIATGVCWFFQIPIETLQERFGVIPSHFPSFSCPNLELLITNFGQYLPDALVVAFLAGVESLLSAVVADGMTGDRHCANAELLAQGCGNVASVLWGGIPATGAIARTATNIKAGAKTPLSGMIHALTLLVILLFLSPIVSHIPLGALCAVLILVGWNMSELSHFRHLLKAPKTDIVILLTTFFLTVFVDLTVAVAVGMSLAAFLFMKRMGDVAGVFSAAMPACQTPPGIEVYEIRGPLFFGVASGLKGIFSNIEKKPKVFILRMCHLQMIDASGMHALEELHAVCQKDGTRVFLSEVSPRFFQKLENFGIIDLFGKESVFFSFEKALQEAEKL